MKHTIESVIQGIEKDQDIPLERSLLILAGVETEEDMLKYERKLDTLQEQLHEYSQSFDNTTNLDRAINLFNFLYRDKPKRYNGNFRLTDVIDGQSTPGEGLVGDCTGLTSLYTVLALREDIPITIAHSCDHVYNLLEEDGLTYHIDSTFKEGFMLPKNSLSPIAEQYLGRFREDQINELIPIVLIKLTKNEPGLTDQEIIELCDYALRVNPDHVNALNKRGNSYRHLKEYAKAEEDFDRAIQIAPKEQEAYNNRGNLKDDQNDKEGAFNDYSSAIDIGKDNEFIKTDNAYVSRAHLKKESKDIDGALEDLDNAIKDNPKNSMAYNNRANIKGMLGDTEGAQQDLKKALEIDPNNFLAKLNLNQDMVA